jgi:hypothetical protein
MLHSQKQMESVSKKNNAFVAKETFPSCSWGEVYPLRYLQICRILSSTGTHIKQCGKANVLYASIFPDCFIRENRNVAIIYRAII